jgi:tetratricopeptide (TPR) repeat protein
VASLLDRIAQANDSAFIVDWIEALHANSGDLEPAFAVRLLRAYRDCGHFDRARSLSASLKSKPTGWSPLDVARLANARAAIATDEGRIDEAETQLFLAGSAIAQAPAGTGAREQLDRGLAIASLELRRGRPAIAADALTLAEQVADGIGSGGWRARVDLEMADLSARAGDPRRAARHYAAAIAAIPLGTSAAIHANMNAALALGAVGRRAEALVRATDAVAFAARAGTRLADAYEVLATIELAADRPTEALEAIERARQVPPAANQRPLGYRLSSREAMALAILGRIDAATSALAKAARLTRAAAPLDDSDALDFVTAKVRVLEARGAFAEAIAVGRSQTTRLPASLVTGHLNVIVGRAALAVGDIELARACLGRAAAAAEAHGWVFPERATTTALLRFALGGSDSRAAEYAQRLLNAGCDVIAAGPQHTPAQPESADRVYLTTREGTTRMARGDLPAILGRYDVSLDLANHSLVAFGQRRDLERKRALEPLVVQLLMRASEGLRAEDIAPRSPASGDADHRVRVLISRVRELFGRASSVERVRGGEVRYRLATGITFALVEPVVRL